MGNKPATLICDGEVEIVRVTEDLYDQAVEIHQKYFMKYENYSIATNLLGSQQSIDEMEILLREVLKDGTTFAAKHRSTNKLVAMCVNKIIIPVAGLTLDSTFKNFTSPAMTCIGEALGRMETTYDIYKEWQIDCAFEIVHLFTQPDFGGKEIAAKLTQHSIAYAKKIRNGTLPERESLPIHVRGAKPQAVYSVFTSNFSQRIGKKLGFETVNKISHKDFEFDGKTFAEKIDPIHEFSTFDAMRI